MKQESYLYTGLGKRLQKGMENLFCRFFVYHHCGRHRSDQNSHGAGNADLISHFLFDSHGDHHWSAGSENF